MDGSKKRLLCLASPSGGGKSTVARHLLSKYKNLSFSISATTRQPRKKELDGREYYFLSKEEFEKRIESGKLVEYEEIFGNYYGTLKFEVDRLLNAGYNIIFDIDVKGALSIKQVYPGDTITIFLKPESPEVLECRLRKRSSETEEQIQTRLARAEMEMNMQDKFDYVIVNEKLEDTFRQVEEVIEQNMEVKS